MRPKIANRKASESELRIAHAQLAGWLEGLVQGIEAPIAVHRLTAQSERSEPGPAPIQRGRLSRDTSYL
jgi:hypothetical protein